VRACLLLPALVLLLAGGCGMYGDLYLEEAPAAPQATEPSPPPELPAENPEEQEDEDDAAGGT
jgi:hypothetical protein